MQDKYKYKTNTNTRQIQIQGKVGACGYRQQRRQCQISARFPQENHLSLHITIAFRFFVVEESTKDYTLVLTGVHMTLFLCLHLDCWLHLSHPSMQHTTYYLPLGQKWAWFDNEATAPVWPLYGPSDVSPEPTSKEYFVPHNGPTGSFHMIS